MAEITLDDIRAAAARIAPIAHRTPVMTSATFDAMTGVRGFFKCENLQKGGAFKIRGAANLVFSLPDDQLQRGVVAFSSGNHAQATALAGRFKGAPVTVVMPDDAPAVKRAATVAAGAAIVTYDRLRDDREAIARGIVEQTGAAVVPPFNHPLIVAGQGTAALELMEQVADLDAIVVQIGGGGLASGTAIAAKALNPKIRVYGVEPVTANDAYLSLQAGHRVTIPPPETIADGLRTPSIGDIPFSILSRLLDGILLVTDDEIRAAMHFFFERMKLVVEPSGAVPAAAVLHAKLPKGSSRVGLIVSGGNVEPAAFTQQA
jgi:threonine dehydratase